MAFKRFLFSVGFAVSTAAAPGEARNLPAESRDPSLQPEHHPARLGFFGEFRLGWNLLRLAARAPDSVLVLPVRTTRMSRVSDTWHADRPGGRAHEGQDIFAPRGTPVHAATAGYVTRVGENRLGGKTVWITGPGRRLYYYAHLDGYRDGLRRGERVDPGTVIGYVGTTGNARGTSPHLHFGVYAVGGAINPLPLLFDPGSPETAHLLQSDSAAFKKTRPRPP